MSFLIRDRQSRSLMTASLGRGFLRQTKVVFQIGTAKYGVRVFELNPSQGAKPGKGGILPDGKVTEEIAQIHAIRAGQDSISPNRHPDINAVGELLDMIERIRSVTGKPVGFKAVIGAYGWLDALLAEIINKRGKPSAPDFITADSSEGAPVPHP